MLWGGNAPLTSNLYFFLDTSCSDVSSCTKRSPLTGASLPSLSIWASPGTSGAGNQRWHRVLALPLSRYSREGCTQPVPNPCAVTTSVGSPLSWQIESIGISTPGLSQRWCHRLIDAPAGHCHGLLPRQCRWSCPRPPLRASGVGWTWVSGMVSIAAACRRAAWL